MRAAFYEGAKAFRTGTASMPRPGPSEALLRVRRVGICGTDLHIFQGHLDHRVPKGGIIGHETFAEIADVPVGQQFPGGRSGGGRTAARLRHLPGIDPQGTRPVSSKVSPPRSTVTVNGSPDRLRLIPSRIVTTSLRLVTLTPSTARMMSPPTTID
jgi:Alcohol dehydrogenase GroES-like domain